MRVHTPEGVPLADHIARVAAGLFYREGIHVVGVDRVAAEAEITKRTLYRYYHSKDDLIAAALRRSPKIRFPKTGSPREQILGAFDALSNALRDWKYRGCPYINAAAELTDRRHPARAIIEELTTRRREWFTQRAVELGATSPQMLGEQLDVLFDGALANATKRAVDTPALAARAAAESLIDAAAPVRVRKRRLASSPAA
jgi:AcrR family transcriptional regulator